MTRKIKFKFLTQVQLETLETAALTFGQLKEELENSNLAGKVNFEVTITEENGNRYENSIKLIEKNTLTEYGDVEDAKLPVGDCIFYVTPTKTKSGAEIRTLEEVEEMGYNEVRSYGSKLNSENGANINLSGRRADIVDAVGDYLLNLPSLEEVDNTVGELKENLVKAVELIEDTLDRMQASEFVDGVTHDELQERALSLKEELNKRH